MTDRHQLRAEKARRNQEAALAAFIEKKAEIDTMLARLKALSDEHFNVAPDAGVNSEARHFGVRIKTFRIIYELLEFIKQEMLDLIPVEYREVVRGHALVKQLFSLSHVGVAAGSLVTDGVMTMEGKARVLRNKKVVHTGAFSSIRHFKDEVKQVTQAQECGILLAGFESFQEGDVIECFSFEELPKAL